MVDFNTEITKQDVLDYIDEKPYLRIEDFGIQYRCRVGERSYMEGVFTTKIYAERALKNYVGNLLKKEQKRIAKRKKNDKKSKS